MPVHTIGAVAPSNPGPYDTWLSYALEHAKFPGHPGNTYVCVDSGSSAQSVQEPGGWVYNNVVYLVVNYGGYLRLFTANDPRGTLASDGTRSWSDKGNVIGAGTGGESLGCIHPGVYIDGNNVYVYYVATSGATSVKVASSTMALVAANPSTAFTNGGAVITKTGGTLFGLSQFGNFSAFKTKSGNIRLLIEGIFGFGGNSWQTIEAESATPTGAFAIKTGTMGSLSPKSVFGFSQQYTTPASSGSLLVEGYRAWGSSGPIVPENGKHVMIYHGADIGAGDSSPISDIYKAVSYDDGISWQPQLWGWPVHTRRDTRWELDQVADPYTIQMPGGVWWCFWTAANNISNRFVIKAAPLSPTYLAWDGFGWVEITQQAPIDGDRPLVSRRRYAIAGEPLFPFEDVPVDSANTTAFSVVLPALPVGSKIAISNVTTGTGTIQVTCAANNIFASTGTTTDSSTIPSGQRVVYHSIYENSTIARIVREGSTLPKLQDTALTLANIKQPTTNIDVGNQIGRTTSLKTTSIARGLLATLRTRIIAAGDTVSNNDLEAVLDPLNRLICSSTWSKLKELWIPIGNSLTGALYKLKPDSTSGNAMTGISLVSGDYTTGTGITGNGTSKAINTGFNPTTAGVTANDWGMGVYTTNLTQSGILAGTLSGTGTYIAYATPNNSNINQQAAGSHFPFARWNAIQLSGGLATNWTGSYIQTSTSLGTGTLDNTTITLLSAGGGFWSSNSVCGWAAWSPGLTQAEMRELTIFFDSANTALWRNNWQMSLVACGDSNTSGFGLGSPTTTRWCALLAPYLGLSEDNQGYNTTSMSDNDNGTSAARWVTNYKISNGTTRSPNLMVVMLGTNDDRYQVSAANFLADYDQWLQWQFQGGVDPCQVILVAPVAATDVLSNSARQQSFRDIVQSLAIKYGCGFYDAWALTNGQSTYFQADSLHLSVAGHLALANGLRSYIASTLSPSTLRRVSW